MRSRGDEVVDGLGVERIHHRHAAKPHIVGEEIEEASSRRHHPRSLPGVDGSFENGAGAGKAERGPPAELLAAALALGHLQHARRAVDVGRGIAAGEEGHVLQELGIEQAHGAAGRREVGEGVDVGNLDVIHHEQVLERAAAADDDVVAEVVGADRRRPAGPARSATRPAGPPALLRISRGATRKPEFFTASGAWNAGAVTVTVCWKSSTVGSVISTVPSSPARTSTGSLVKGRPSRGRISSRYASRAQLADAKHAAGVAGGARGGVEGAHAHALGRLAGGVHDHAADGAHAGGVLCSRRRADEGQHDGGQRRRDARTEREGATCHGCHATRPPMRTSSCW